MIKRTKPHKSYAELDRRDIQSRFREIGFEGAYSYDLVRDIAHAYSFYERNESVSDSFLDIKSQLNSNDFDSMKEYNEAVQYHENVQQFLSSLTYEKFTGDTPLQKAASVVAALSSQEGGSGEEGEGAPLPIFMPNEENGDETIEEKVTKLHEDVDQVVDINESSLRFTFNPEGKSPEASLSTLTKKQKGLLSKMAVLGTKGKIKAKRQSKEMKFSRMNQYSQVSRLANVSSMMMPTFKLKFMKKELTVKKPKQASKQLLVFIIDSSTSMNTREKHQWVTALLYNRLDAVAKGEAELFIGYFLYDVDVDSFSYLRNKADVKRFLQDFSISCPYNEGTDVGKSVKTTIECIKKGYFGDLKINTNTNPEIVVMNDGQDCVDPTYTPEITTHGFILGTDNEDMEAMCNNSGGIYERFL